MRLSVLFLFLALFCITSPTLYGQAISGKGDRISGLNFATRSPILGKHGMVATSHPLATQIGLDVLKQGGTAVDAAIGANTNEYPPQNLKHYVNANYAIFDRVGVSSLTP